MKKKIAILLPYKEKYTLNESAAASIWVKDYLKKSNLENQTLVFGNLSKNKPPLTSNFINLDIESVKFKKNYFYTKRFLDKCNEFNFLFIK